MASKTTTVEFNDLLEKLGEKFTNLIDNTEPLGIMSGLSGMDQILGGFKPSELTIIAARTGVGKTAFMTHLAKQAFFNARKVAFFSLEMPVIQIASRLFVNMLEIPADLLSHGGSNFTSQEREFYRDKIRNGIAAIHNLQCAGKFFISDQRRISVEEIRECCEQIGDLDMVFVDYIQLVSPPQDHKTKDRHLQIGEVSMQLHSLAGDLGVSLIAGAQIKRLGRGNKPGLEDLRESGSLEQDSDQVIILDRDLDSEGVLPKEGTGTLSVLKNRHGLNGSCAFYYTGGYFKFEDFVLENESEE